MDDEILIKFTPSEVAVTTGCLISRLHLHLGFPDEEITKNVIRGVLDKLEAALLIHISAMDADQN
jgi:hypothetical protein